jgi:hypothetical protein
MAMIPRSWYVSLLHGFEIFKPLDKKIFSQTYFKNILEIFAKICAKTTKFHEKSAHLHMSFAFS